MEIDPEPTTLLKRIRAFIRLRVRRHLLVLGVLLVILGVLGFFVLKIEDLSLTRGADTYPTDTYATVQLHEALKDLSPGRIFWNPPLLMHEGVDYPVEAHLSFNIQQRESMSQWLGSGPLQVSTEQLSKVVRVELTAAPAGAFAIESHVQTEQIIPAPGYARWVWTITPKRAGNFHVLLNVANVISDDRGNDRIRVIPLPPRQVHVTVRPVYRLIQFVRANQGLLISGVAIPLVVAFWAWLRRGRTKPRKRVGF